MNRLFTHSFNKYIERLNLGYLIIFIILLSVPLTQVLVKEEQLLQKEATTNSCSISLAEPSIENNPIEFSHPPLCQAAESHEVSGKLEGCDDYYIGWWCSPRMKTTQQDVLQACRGWANPLISSYKVNFRNRVNYIRDGMLKNMLSTTTNSFEARRSIWNYIMTEVKSINTTFGISDPQGDLDYAARQIFNRSWEEVKRNDQQINCPIDAWEKLCRSDSKTPEILNCPDGYSCSSYPSVSSSNTPSFTCVK